MTRSRRGGIKAAFLGEFTSKPFKSPAALECFMRIARRPLGRACCLIVWALSLMVPAMGAEKPRVKAEDYTIDAEIVPKTHRLVARARVKFTALDDINFASFELHNGLRTTKIVD